MRDCGRSDHVDPWYNCAGCRASSGYRVSLAGMSVQPEDYLPPVGEVDARRRETAERSGAKRTVETFGEAR